MFRLARHLSFEVQYTPTTRRGTSAGCARIRHDRISQLERRRESKIWL